ncbi:uncharacterized protein LOC122932412 isoform X2 [Bufo gargarizans]|uniref:uncharacterized protein LOC122932412 isoform X2 n=1 Tax=Bufo gargarizans TaxID=30331 RepID=UPI001CF50D10|nr:uncharacterized protein LOC122932412 isoform X2 [Bufo gargarizans]
MAAGVSPRLRWETLEQRKHGGENLYYQLHAEKMQQLPADVHRFCDPETPAPRRKELLHLLRSLEEGSSCQRLQILFSFSVPSPQVLELLCALNVPLVSAGATGGPELLEHYPDRALFLAWPDADESSQFSLDCLAFFRGHTLFHVGELLGETLSSNPWGQSTSRAFQLSLAEDFCCVKRFRLPSWPGQVDSFSVWKRKNPQFVLCDGAHFQYVETDFEI